MLISKFFKIWIIGIFCVVLFWSNFSSAEKPIQAPIINYPTGVSEELVDTSGYFQWNKIQDASTYAIILTPTGAVIFNSGNVQPCPEQIAGECVFWQYDTLQYNSTYKLSVQGCEDQDINSCGPSTIISFQTAPRPISSGSGEITGSDGTGDGTGDGSPVDLFGPIQSQSLDDLFNTVINFLLVLAFVIGPLMIIYAGFLILTAAGDAKKMSKAKTIILWTLIALAIILFAKGLTSLVKGALSN